MKVVGKSSIILTEKSAVMRVYLSNDEGLFRLALWDFPMDHQIDKAAESLAVNSVSFLILNPSNKFAF